MGVVEPGGAQVVEVGKGSLLEFGGIEAGRVEPAVAELDEAAGGLPYSLALLVGGAWEWEGLEGGRRRVVEAGFDRSPMSRAIKRRRRTSVSARSPCSGCATALREIDRQSPISSACYAS